MRTFLLLLSLANCSSLVLAQAKITGTVRNKDGQAVEAATVLLHRQKDSTIIRSAVSDKSGGFVLDRVGTGAYFLSATSVGYDRYMGAAVVLESGESKAVNIVVSPVAKSLQAVSVEAKKPFVEWKLDKMVVNVESSPFFTPGMSALDILERSPGIEVDYVNNTIGLITKPGTTIYINGRKSYLSGVDLLNYLRGLPAGSIEQVEIMSQPSARFDAGDGSGVINIVLKKNQADGLLGSVTASAIFGYYFKTRDNLMLNWRQDKVNLNFTMGVSDFKTFNDQHTLSSFRSGYGVPFSQYQDYQTSVVSDSRSYTPELAMDYQVSKNSSLGLNLSGLFSTNVSSTNGTVNLLDSLKQVVQQQSVPTSTRNTVSNPGVNVNWLLKLGGGRELTADADYLHYHSPGVQDSYLLDGSLPSDIDIYAFKADYSQPLGPKGGAHETKLEAGVKTSYVRTDNNSVYSQYDTLRKVWEPDTALNNHFIYSENINAAYVNFSRQLSKKWSVELGVRAEQTIAAGNELVESGSFRHSYLNAFPTGYVGYVLNDKNSFSLSYGRGIGRPSYLDLNPFRYVINQYNIRVGNPKLQPDFSNSFELQYHYKSELFVGLFYYRFDNMSARVYEMTGQGDDLITILTKENVAYRRNIFFYVGYTKGLTKWWNANWTVVVINAKLDDPANVGYTIDQLTGCKVNFNNNFRLGNGWSVDLRANYATRWMEGIRIHQIPSWNNSVGVNKKMLNDKGTLTLNLSDPFYVYRPGQTTDAAAFYTQVNIRPESRYLTVTWNYRFGQAKQQRREHNGGSAEDEQRRVNL
jgi:hypothetical protein